MVTHLTMAQVLLETIADEYDLSATRHRQQEYVEHVQECVGDCGPFRGAHCVLKDVL